MSSLVDGARTRDEHHDVLVVDDDPAIVRLLKLTLRGGGFDVTGASNGEEALEEVDRHAPEAIVLDIDMPVMNGREFYERLRARHIHIPVVILSAYNPRRVQRELGAQAYIGKPFEPDELIDIVWRVM
ncbi:MAG TPA: response regulator [Dehalococcoidia bacterium]|nr:response regulator [Dehalococcoidia bacterium]